MRKTVGYSFENVRSEASRPRISINSSRTIRITSWPGDRLVRISSPRALTRTRSSRALTTFRLTSASRRASRTSRKFSSTTSSLRTPCTRKDLKTFWKRLCKASNIDLGRQLALIRLSRTLHPAELLLYICKRLKGSMFSPLALTFRSAQGKCRPQGRRYKRSLPGHELLNVFHCARQAPAEEFVPILGDEDVILDADANFLFGNINARLHGYHHAGLEGHIVVHGVMDVQADRVAQAMDEVL